MYVIISTSRSHSHSQPVCQNCGSDRFSAKPLRLTNTPFTPQSIFCMKCGRIAGFSEILAPERGRRLRNRG